MDGWLTGSWSSSTSAEIDGEKSRKVLFEAEQPEPNTIGRWKGQHQRQQVHASVNSPADAPVTSRKQTMEEKKLEAQRGKNMKGLLMQREAKRDNNAAFWVSE